jgi:purine-binding chemotaxis protein CheW
MSTTLTDVSSPPRGTDLAGKYLTFVLGSEEFGLEILKVREIIGYMQITAVPRTPAYIKGVINLRGQVIPVVDMRAKFEMEATDVSEQTCIVVVEVSCRNGRFFTGVIVDRVREVLDIDSGDIEPAPEFDSDISTSFILGMGKIGGTVKILLDIDEVLRGEGLESLAGTR